MQLGKFGKHNLEPFTSGSTHRMIFNLIRSNLWRFLLFPHHQSFRSLIAPSPHGRSSPSAITARQRHIIIWSKAIAQDCKSKNSNLIIKIVKKYKIISRPHIKIARIQKNAKAYAPSSLMIFWFYT